MKKLVKRIIEILTIVSLIVTITGCGGTTANSPAGNRQSSAASFYEGKTLTIIVPYGVGGGYDQWARLIAPYMQKYLGVAKVEVVNQPGGGGLVGANKIYAAKPDGLTIGDGDAVGAIFAQIAHTPGVNFDVSKFNWLGRPDDDPHIIAVHRNGPYQSFVDLIAAKRKGITIRALATGVGSTDYNNQLIVFNAFKIPVQMVAAFASSGDEKASFLSGNGDTLGFSASDVLQIPNAARIIALISTKPFAKLPDVPTIIDLANKEKLSTDNVNALKTLAGLMDLGHPFFAPPGVPADRLEALRNAFKQSVADPQFIAAAEKAKLFLGYASPDELKQMADTGLSEYSSLKTLLRTK